MPLKSVYHSGPVTALCFCHDSLILAGVGSCLHLYIVHPTVKQLQILEVLPGRNIHGIVPELSKASNKRICVFGQKCIRLVELDGSSVKPVGDLLEFSDWIWNVTWLQDKNALCLALGHNVVLTFDLESAHVIRTVHCEEKCILYCAKFLTSISNTLVLAAGTVFNQVVLWSPVGQRNSQDRAVVFHRLTGHQGVIFSIDYDPASQRICSVSDDRSIRLYQVQFPSTGSGTTLTDWENMSTSLQQVLYGHSARVWDVKLLSTVLVSVGEDSTCCVWSYEGNVLQKLKGHKGKSIWSMAVDKGENYIVTGGGDHSVRLWDLKKEASDSQLITKPLDLKIEASDFPRNTQLLGFSRALVITNSGKLLMVDCATNKPSCLFSDDAFSSYTVMAVSNHNQAYTVAVGNIHGTLRILHAQTLQDLDCGTWVCEDVTIYDGKIFSVHWLDDKSLLTTGPEGVVVLCSRIDCQVMRYYRQQDEVDVIYKIVRLQQNVWILQCYQPSINLSLSSTLELPTSKQRWVTTASYTPDGTHIVCGDRSGSVFLYKLVEEHKLFSTLLHTFPKIHGKAGVTHVCCHGDQVYSAGRDGRYRVYALTEDGEMTLLNTSRVCKGFEWLETLLFTDDGDLEIHGFYTSMFVVWSVKHNQKILEVECGGGHRAWSYDCHGNTARLVYVKAREVIMKDIVMKTNQTIVKGSLHGREMCDVKHVSSIPSNPVSGKCSDVIVTCSEDTAVCLSVLHYEHGLPCLAVLHSLSGHISSVRCLSVCQSSVTAHGSSNSRLIFSGGGRAQMKVWRVRITNPEVLDNFEGATCGISLGVSRKDDLNRSYSEAVNDYCDINEVCGDEMFAECNENDNGNEYRKSIRNKEAFSGTGTCTTFGSSSEGCSVEDIRKLADDTCIECLAGLQLGQSGRRRRKPWRQPVDNSDPETRILDLTVFRACDLNQSLSKTIFFVSTACSDGLVRFFAFQEDSRELTLLTAAFYHDHCVLKSGHMIVSIDHMTEEPEYVTSKNRAIILSASTDGIVAFWDVTDMCERFVEVAEGTSEEVDDDKVSTELKFEIRPFHTLTLHQSGINSLFVKHIKDSNYMIVTGGDDNAVHLTVISLVTIEGNVNLKVIRQGSQVFAHAAQVTGVWCVSPQLIITASIDQRVALWTISDQDSSLKMEMIECKFVSVSDIANIHAWIQGMTWHVLVCGEGLELLQFDLPSGRPSDVHVDPIVSATRLVS